ncbi:MAG TPA: histidine kinase dimerization/phosphoacceptor domain -containing protein [Chitinophagaceae bacterium]|jgi:two-component sensor histidine kinase|nr:histidine kinase dimerization/phosphoacceptor domain -containing protein [Chitinophagaceae bacterium]
MLRSFIVIVLLICCYYNSAQTTSTKPAEEQQLLRAVEISKPGADRVQQLLRVGNYYLTKDGEEKEDIDKALQYAVQAKNMANEYKYSKGVDDAMQLTGHTYIEMGDRGRAAAILQQVNQSTKVKLLYIYSAYYRYGGVMKPDPDSAVYFARAAKSLATTVNDAGYKIRAIEMLMHLYNGMRRFDEAEEEAEQFISESAVAGNKNVHECYDFLSVINQNNGNYDKALTYSLKGIQNMYEMRDSSNGGIYYFDLAVIYKHTGQHVRAIEAYERARTIQKKMWRTQWHWLIQSEITAICIKMGNYEDALTRLKKLQTEQPARTVDDSIQMHQSFTSCYRLLKQHDRAKLHFNKLVEIDKRIGYNQELHKYIGQYYTEMGQYSEAKPFLEEVLKRMPNGTATVTVAHLRFMLFRVDSALGNYQSAIQHLIVNKAMDDTVYRRDKIRQVRELQVKYETDHKDQELAFRAQNILLLQRQAELRQKDLDQARVQLEYETISKEQGLLLAKAESEKKDNELLVKEQRIQLLNNEAQLKQSSLRNANLVKNFTLAGIGVLFLLLLLVMNQFRIKQRNNKIMAQKNLSLERLVTEKEWLLKEVHHRVKNNLHTVMSLLESQSAFLDNGDALAVMQKSQHRVYAMSLIHQKLYQAENTTSIDMSVYLPELLNYLTDSFDTGQRIRFNYEIADIRLDVSKAIPAGLILNEAITNAIKYAFPGDRRGEVNIKMKRGEGRKLQLEVADNGIGIPADLVNGNANSLGFKLMKGLSEDMHGTLRVQNDNGVRIVVDFSEDLVE